MTAHVWMCIIKFYLACSSAHKLINQTFLPSQVSRDELDWSTNELRNCLRAIEWDLEDLSETISILYTDLKNNVFLFLNDEVISHMTKQTDSLSLDFVLFLRRRYRAEPFLLMWHLSKSNNQSYKSLWLLSAAVYIFRQRRQSVSMLWLNLLRWFMTGVIVFDLL